VACDLCGLECRDEFTYYSYDLRPVEVLENQRPSLESILSTTTDRSIDVCPVCFEDHKKKVVSNYAKILSPKRRPAPVCVTCEISGEVLAGSYHYHYVCVTKVDVRISGGRASQKIDERHVDFNVSETIFREMTNKTGQAKKVAGGDWSTSSK